MIASCCGLSIWIALLMSIAAEATQNFLPVAMDDCDLWVHRVARMVLADNHSKELAQKRIMAYQAMLDDNLEKSFSRR